MAECLSVRPWCSGVEEWPRLVGSAMATIHGLLDTCYPADHQHAPINLRRGLPPAFHLPSRMTSGMHILDIP